MESNLLGPLFNFVKDPKHFELSSEVIADLVAVDGADLTPTPHGVHQLISFYGSL